MERLRRAGAFALGALFAGGVQAAGGASWYAQIDNDVVFHTDRWYTSGLRIARTQPLESGAIAELGVLQEIYTPDTKAINLVDRPYTARLMLTAARHEAAPGFFRTLEIDAGVRGPSALGRQSARFIHQIIPAPHFDWSRQLPDRADAQAAGVQTHEFALAGDRARWAVHYGAVIGTNVTFAHAGAEIRTGGEPAIASPALRFAATPPLTRAGALGWGGFAGASVRAVARNTLLSENANPAGPPIERRNEVVRIAAGVSWAASWGALAFALAQDSKEFDGQPHPHRFGALSLRLDFW